MVEEPAAATGHSWSLRSRFLLVALACLLPLLAVTAYVLFSSITHGRDQVIDAQTATAEVVAQVLAGTLAENERVLQEVTTTDRVQKMEAVGVSETLDQFRRARPNLYGMFVADSEGDLLASSGLDPAPIWNFPSFHDAVDRSRMLGEPGVSSRLTTGDATMIALTLPMRPKDNPEDGPAAVVGSMLSVERLKDAVFPVARGQTIIAIIAQNEIIAAQGMGLDQAMLDEQLAEPLELAMSGVVGSVTYNDSAGEHLAAYAPVPGADWAVLVTHPSPTTYAPNRMLLERGLLALGLATLATLALVLVLGEWIARPLRVLTAQAAAIVHGDFSPRPLPGGSGEISQLGDAFHEMSERIAEQVQELDIARQKGEEQAVQLRELHRRTIRLQEDERRRIAGEIHDAVAPLITGALYQARAIQLGGPDRGEADGEDLRAISDLLGKAMDELHNVIFALRPPDLDDLGVVAAIERYMDGVERAGLDCELEVVGENPELTPEVRLAIYRIVQEALHNALRHAAADRAVVTIENTGDTLRVSIRDNGAGFNPDTAKGSGSLGLLSMRERAAAIGAEFSIASRPGDGTTVTIERPIEGVVEQRARGAPGAVLAAAGE
jgi:signal transduction histidine kinase